MFLPYGWLKQSDDGREKQAEITNQYVEGNNGCFFIIDKDFERPAPRFCFGGDFYAKRISGVFHGTSSGIYV